MDRDEVFYRAMLARDSRFDGKFFIGVKTTGIYCRPICPAKPSRANVEFFPDAAAAERAGYRPCLRCRPECAPLSPDWDGRSIVVRQALKRIAANDRLEGGEEVFAARFGVSSRHLRRLFREEVGRSPKQIADINRLNFTRRLVVETDMPLISVALTAGFRSVRRFNDAFRTRFERSPSQMRRRTPRPDDHGWIELHLAFRPPYDRESILRFHAAHALPEIESVSADCWERVFRIRRSVGVLQVRPDDRRPGLNLRVLTDDPRVLFEVTRRVRRVFDLDSDPSRIAESFAADADLARLLKKRPGLRLPGGWDPFETAIRIILTQVVSVRQASALIEQLIRVHGPQVRHPATGQVVRLFPDAATLAGADLSTLRTGAARKQTVRRFSALVASGELNLTETQDTAMFRRRLLAVPGIGRWSAEFIAMHCIGDTDSFPDTDLILHRALQLHPRLNPDAVKPWRSYAAVCLHREYADLFRKPKGAVA